MEYKDKIDKLVANREEFDKFVYMSFDDATKEIERRQNDKLIEKYLEKTLPHGIPIEMRGKKSVVLFRHIATLNYEILRFISLTSVTDKFQQLIIEYSADKFTNRNEGKFFLGKMSFVKGTNKKNEAMFESQNIINFNTSNFKPISSIKTLWGQSLVDFHHELFFKFFPELKGHVFDLSEWIHENGDEAKKYYKYFLSLFLKHGMLFENFLLENNELAFTKDIILPAIMEIEKETGMRPIIVALEPTDIEDSKFWLSHPYNQKKIVVWKTNHSPKIIIKNTYKKTKKILKDLSHSRSKIFSKFISKISTCPFSSSDK
ncbi:MAG: hypothetical protein WCF92_01825 [bacterium]